MAIFISSEVYHDGGIDLGFYNSILVASLVICSLLFLTSLFKPIEHLGLIVLPITIFCFILNMLFDEPSTGLTYNAGVQIHIITSIIAFSILCLAAVQALLLFLQERSIKHHSSSVFLRSLPSLHESERILFQSISLGVLVLTVALITGFIFLDDIFAQHLVHKTTLSCLAWLVFVVLLWGRFQFGWRGATAIRWYLGGFTFLILAYYGSKIVLELILN
ncbi:MAG: cytochrome c biogenesis protein CcsA [Pseudomonadota bacterium]